MTVAQLRQMSNDEYLYWQAFYALENQQRELDALKAKGKG